MGVSCTALFRSCYSFFIVQFSLIVVSLFSLIVVSLFSLIIVSLFSLIPDH